MKCEACGEPDASSDGVGLILCDDCYYNGYKSNINKTEDGQYVFVPSSLLEKIEEVLKKG